MAKMNKALMIKEQVTMPMILEMYSIRTNKYRRIPCPLHRGKKDNFGYTNNVYHCFSCGAKGDVITFVQEYFGMDFQSAMRKIDSDFNLGFFSGEYIPLSKRALKPKVPQLDPREIEYIELCNMLREIDSLTDKIKVSASFSDLMDKDIYAIQNKSKITFRIYQLEEELYGLPIK